MWGLTTYLSPYVWVSIEIYLTRKLLEKRRFSLRLGFLKSRYFLEYRRVKRLYNLMFLS